RMTGTLTIAGLGPGDAALITPEVTAALADATDVVGYTPYVARVAGREGLVLHASDNRQELLRAAEAMRLSGGRRRGGLGPPRRRRLLRRSRRVRDGIGRVRSAGGIAAVAGAYHPRLAGRDGDAGRRGACRRAARA